jgi:hypothetical protein
VDRFIFVIKRLVNREIVWAAAILIALLHLCFFSCIWGDKTLLESARDQPSIMPQGAWAGSPRPMAFPKMLDTGAPAWVPEPFLALIGSDYTKELSLPLWNPYQGYGGPLAADMQSQPFYPLSIALSLHPTPRTYSWFILFRLFLAGICAYSFIRLFVSFVPALAAGVTSMFAGYYILFITMPHLSVEVLLPASLLAAEHLLRRPKYRTVVLFAAIIFLMIAGGMPESSVMLLSFLYLYIAFRLVVDPRLYFQRLRRISYLLIATVSGFALSGLLLLPFHEYMTLGFDLHQPANIGGAFAGLAHDPRNLSIFTYLFPLLYGPPFSSTLSPGWNGLRNYAGLVGLFLALVAILGSSRVRGRRDRLLSALAWFFGFCAVVLPLKRYGIGPINLIGTLPFFKMVQFTKYEEVVLSICISMLCAIGLERMRRRQVALWAQTSALALTFMTIPLALIFSHKMLAKEVLVDHIALGFPLWSLGLPVCLLFCLSLLLIYYNRKNAPERRYGGSVSLILTTAMLALVVGESIFSYVVPAYYSADNRLPTRAENPYLGAPFIKYLQAHAGRYRILAEDRILFPNWASAFKLFDIRDLDAMYYNRYLPFLRAFFPGQIRRNGDELDDRFTGQGNFELTDVLQKRLLQLSSVRYFITMKAMAEPNTIIDEIWKQNEGHLISGKEKFVSRQSFVLDNAARGSLGEHPPYNRLPYSLVVDNEKLSLHFSYALNPAVFEHTCGDGVDFVLEAKGPSGKISRLFSNYIDPKHNLNERHWMDGSVDLSSYRGQKIELLLSTDGGPNGNTCNDWAAWSNFHYDSAGAGKGSSFKLAYNQEVKIYQYANVLPRAAVYYNAAVKKDDDGVLRELGDPDLDVFHSVVLNQSELDQHQRKIVEEVNAASPALGVKPARITLYESRSVKIEAVLDRSGILVLNDSNYPGWDVEVDGHKGKILQANYLFRGVLLTSGKHVIRFSYNPRSFRRGLALSLASLGFLASWGFIIVFKRRRKKGSHFALKNPAGDILTT